MCAWREEAESGLSGEESRRKRWAKVEVDSVMASVKQNQSGVSLEEFLNLVSTKKAAHFYQSEVRQLFTAFDRQCRGYLSLEDFRKAFSVVAPKLPERTVVEAFREVDQDSDGHISFKDFELAMNYGQDNLSALPLS
ncbi:EF-hand calcium-binding domain-containing protein 11 isoform X3 [Lacerta agilis]|uniref:EF-hand calcium-binding domain-containing protein 11 isoform X3 n=1 Tax=Lacerta agilis TaxID=80427 RepID=UPI0014195DC9|nr:EF-hand calcium-binding domain-containing protein 11 isoform X3 [Lacerta agilis]